MTVSDLTTPTSAPHRSLVRAFRILWTGLALIVIIACGTVDLTINQSLTWSLIVVVGVVALWLVGLALVPFRRGRLLIAMLVLTAAAPAVLAVVGVFTGEVGLIWSIALVPMVVGLVWLWLLVIVFAWTHLNLWFKLSFMVFTAGLVSLVINASLHRSVGTDFPSLDTYINTGAALVATVAFLAVGLMRRSRSS
ncbi:MAG: hypothetical protein LBV00_12070 [Propionibacteriaceae bacterium]|nr:hypothetical protein [Propionibacteriaceae bacterium]